MRKKSRGKIRGSLSFRRIGFCWRGETVYYRSKFRVRGRSKDLEGFCHVRNSSIGAHYEQRSIVQFVLGIVRGVQLADFATWVAGEQNGEIFVPCPRCERGVGIHTDAQHGDLASVVEERGVLITVRLHLDGSALCPRLIEESENYRAPAKVRKFDGRLDEAVPICALQGKIRRDVIDHRSGSDLRGGGRGLLCVGEATGERK
jgi:hypothetical protein